MFRFTILRQIPLQIKGASKRWGSTGNCQLDLDKCAELSYPLVEQAARLLTEACGRRRNFDTKGHRADLVTATDREIEELLISGLQMHFPKHVYIGEEGISSASTGHKLTDEPTWIIDPIDGTMNFVHGFSFSCISVGLWVNKQPQLAICCNPTLDLNFTARRHCGAYLNGAPIRVSGQTDLRRSLILCELHPTNFATEHKDMMWANANKFALEAHAMRATGSAVLNYCLVAMGAADAYFEFFNHSWDSAAGALLVREAGGVIMDPAGGEFDLMSRRVVAAATHELGCQVVELLGDTQIYPHRDDEPHN